jgi:hypothetical protein
VGLKFIASISKNWQQQSPSHQGCHLPIVIRH